MIRFKKRDELVLSLLRFHEEQAQKWADERRELLNRIQRPEHIPFPVSPDFVMPEPEPDEINLVGTIREAEE